MNTARTDVLMQKGLAAYRSGDFAEAVALLGQAVEQVPGHATAHYNLALALRRLGDLRAALQHFQHAAKRAPQHFESHFESAQTLLGLGQAALAARYFNDLIERQPGHAASYCGLARALTLSGQEANALALLSAAAREFPRDAQVHTTLGNLFASAQRWAEAEQAYAASNAVQPRDAVTRHNHAVVLQELGRTREAIEAFERALAIDPAYAGAHYGLGLSLQKRETVEGREAALRAFDAAIHADAGDPRFHTERARTLLHLGRPADALAELDVLVARQQAGAEAHNLRGIALKNLGRAAEAMDAYDQALALQPDLAEALNNRGNLRLLSRQFAPALADFDRALALRPEFDWLPGTRLYAAAHVFDWDGFAASRAALAAGVLEGRRCVQPLALQCLVDDPRLQQLAARRWVQSTCAGELAPAAPRARHDAGRIRIAYISRDLRAHPVAYLMAEVLELHDRERFEVIAIHYGPVEHEGIQPRLRAAVDRFIDAEALPEREITVLARSLGVDIAIDLTGFTEGARSGIFTARAAPVQMSYLGYLGSAGTGLHDYLIADATLVPPATRDCYDERLIVLPSYQANDRQRPRPPAARRADVGLPEAGFVFCCFNNSCKIAPEHFDAWVDILQQAPGAVLWILGEDEQARANLREQAQRRGLAPERIVFAPRQDRETYLACVAVADLFLDTLPYNAGTTASDALWMGLPVLTQPGQSFAARMAASLLEAIGLPELIAPTRETYVQAAVALARDPALLATIRTKLETQRSAGRLFDTPRFTRSLEQAFEQAHRLSLDGAAPRDITVEDRGL
ncbi:MAG: tetratricopeptide repeat protein [Paucibacter sp.]|nr:tetratricopeptide repeat protein [Roseateles sp.]